MKHNSKICFLPLPNNVQERAAPAALSNPSAARYSQPRPLCTYRTIKNIPGNSLRLFFQLHIASISSVPWASFLCGFLSGICGCVVKWFLWIFPFMWAKLLLPSWYFIWFFLFCFPSILSCELWVLKSTSAKGRPVDLDMDAGECQLSSSEQHTSIWQPEEKKVCLS